MCKTDEAILLQQRDDEYEFENGAVLPNQFQTVHGKMVNQVGKQKSEGITVVLYSTSKIQGNVLLNPNIENATDLLSDVDSIYDDGFLEDDNGQEVSSLVLPIDAIDLSPKLRGVIVDCDLRNYQNGFNWLLGFGGEKPIDSVPDNQSTIISSTIQSLIDFVKTMRHISDKGYCFNSIDGHQLYFNAEYGAFRFVYDGIDMYRADDDTDSSAVDKFNSSISAIAIYLLLGWWPHYAYNSLVSFPGKDSGLDPDDYEDPSDPEHEVFSRFVILPSSLQETIIKSCTDPINEVITPAQWETVLKDSMNDIESCVHCGFEVFQSAKECWHCGQDTNKEALLTKWEITDSNLSHCIRLSFGRGITVPGDFFGFSTGLKPYMKIMYNPKKNALGVKNVSNITWVIIRNETTEALAPGSIATIEKNMTIEFEGHPGIEARFMGYEK